MRPRLGPIAALCAALLAAGAARAAAGNAAEGLAAQAPVEHEQRGFDQLEPPLQERARALGYQPGEMVTLRRLPDGRLVVEPPAEEARTPDQLQAKLTRVLTEKVFRRAGAQVTVSATLSEDNTGHFDVEVPWEEARRRLQEEAERLGHKAGAKLLIRVDAQSWEVKIAPPRPPAVPGASAPPRLPTGLPFASQGSRFMVGVRAPFAKLEPADQRRARKLGYGDDDEVWQRLTEQGKLEIFPKRDAGAGPEMEVLSGRVDPKTEKVWIYGVTRLDKLNPERQAEARAAGYDAGDHVGLEYSRESGEFRILPVARKVTRSLMAAEFPFDQLDAAERAAALQQGYAEGKPVWKSIQTDCTAAVTPAGEMAEAPVYTLLGVAAGAGDRPAPVAIGSTTYSDLEPLQKEQALKLGYPPSGEVAVEYQCAAKRVRILPPEELTRRRAPPS